MAELRYVEAGPGDIAKIDAFHRLPDPRVLKYEYWTYDPDRSVFFMALDGDRLVGTQAFMPYELVINGKRILTGRSERTLVSAEYRGRDVFAQLVEHCCRSGTEKGHRFFWGYSTSAIKALQRTGFVHITGHREYLVAATGAAEVASRLGAPGSVPLSPKKALQAVRSGDMRSALEYFKLAVAPVSLAVRAPFAAARALGAAAGVTITEVPLREDDLDGLYERLRGKGKLVTLHHTRRLHDWALVQGQYDARWLFAYRGAELVAYVCLTEREPGTALLVDFAAADAAAFRELLEEARSEARRRGCPFVMVVCNPLNALQQRLFPALLAAGFVRSFRRAGNSIIRMGVYKDMTILQDPAPWYMTDLWGLIYGRLPTQA